MSDEKEVASAIDGLAHAVSEDLSVAIQDCGVRIGDALSRIANALETIIEKADASMR